MTGKTVWKGHFLETVVDGRWEYVRRTHGIGAAVILAAERDGVAGSLRDELQTSLPQLYAKLGRGIPDMFPKAYRWVAEFEEVAAFVGPGAERQMFEAIAALYARLAADVAGDRAETGKLGGFFTGRESEPRG